MAYSYATDITPARRLAKHIEKYGIRVSIELQSGAGGSGWLDVRHRLNMSHHTVSRPSMGDTPCLRLVKVGRVDVPGPLCNGYMGYDRVYRIITMGRANHPGAGGPITLDGLTVPKDNGRPYIWGTEFEGGLEEWSREMHVAMAAVNAGITDWLAEDHGRTVECNLEHSTWAPGRKIDRLNYTRALSIVRINAILSGASGGIGGGLSPISPIPPTTQEDDMPLTDADVSKIVSAVWGAQIGRDENRTTLAGAIGTILTRTATENVEGAVERAVTAALSTVKPGEAPVVDVPALQAAVREAIVNAVADVRLVLS